MTSRFTAILRWALVSLLGISFWPAETQAQGLCARVVIQIEQELTLEREGFEARLGVSNGMANSLDDFSVTLKFMDSEYNPVVVSTDSAPDSNGKFYYRVQTGYTVPTSIAAGAEQKIAYLIVPAPGAAGSAASGSLYYVGATIKYKVSGIEQTVEVASDYITVRPMPVLGLQYFLPGDVYGDDPMSETVEPVVPFALGVRVCNHSAYATARKVKIQSGQPEIIENLQDLLIDYRIVGCQVNGSQTQPTLLVNFGDIGPNRSSVANWWMTSSLSGRFVKFTAEVEHAPEFGGTLTSLIPEDAITTHRLIGQILVDSPGRDNVLDFLASDAMTGAYANVKAYESDDDVSSVPVDYYAPGDGLVSLVKTDTDYRLSISATSAMLYAKVASPIPKDQVVKAVRSDGKKLPASNCWISKNKNGTNWEYWLNIFDTNLALGESYTLTFSDPVSENQPPILALVDGRMFTASVGRVLKIHVKASDPDGLIPSILTGDLPDGASFVDARDGTGVFTWQPAATQIGSYIVQFKASDGQATDSKSVAIQVTTGTTSGYSTWTNEYWPGVTDQTIIGPEADPDGDGVGNLLEYAFGGNPTVLDESCLPQIGLTTQEGKQYLMLTFLRRTGDSSLTYEAIGSDSLYMPLSEWIGQTKTLAVAQANTPVGFERIAIVDSVAVESGPIQRYLRVRVKKAE